MLNVITFFYYKQLINSTSNIIFSDDINSILPERICDDTLHNDCINGVSFNPHSSKSLATCSGQRHHYLNLSKWSGSSDEASDEETCPGDSSLKVWNIEIE